jgi:hypothetical protein
MIYTTLKGALPNGSVMAGMSHSNQTSSHSPAGSDAMLPQRSEDSNDMHG